MRQSSCVPSTRCLHLYCFAGIADSRKRSVSIPSNPFLNVTLEHSPSSSNHPLREEHASTRCLLAPTSTTFQLIIAYRHIATRAQRSLFTHLREAASLAMPVRSKSHAAHGTADHRLTKPTDAESRCNKPASQRNLSCDKTFQPTQNPSPWHIECSPRY